MIYQAPQLDDDDDDDEGDGDNEASDTSGDELADDEEEIDIELDSETDVNDLTRAVADMGVSTRGKTVSRVQTNSVLEA